MESQAGIAASKCISIFPMQRGIHTLKLWAGWTRAAGGMQGSSCQLWGCARRHK